jgi:hypothetical protein
MTVTETPPGPPPVRVGPDPLVTALVAFTPYAVVGWGTAALWAADRIPLAALVGVVGSLLWVPASARVLRWRRVARPWALAVVGTLLAAYACLLWAITAYVAGGGPGVVAFPVTYVALAAVAGGLASLWTADEAYDLTGRGRVVLAGVAAFLAAGVAVSAVGLGSAVGDRYEDRVLEADLEELAVPTYLPSVPDYTLDEVVTAPSREDVTGLLGLGFELDGPAVDGSTSVLVERPRLEVTLVDPVDDPCATPAAMQAYEPPVCATEEGVTTVRSDRDTVYVLRRDDVTVLVADGGYDGPRPDWDAVLAGLELDPVSVAELAQMHG